MSKFVILLLVISLTGNLFPAINVAAILGLLLLYIVHRKTEPAKLDLAPQRARQFLIYAYVFWLTSYLLTGVPLGNLFSYEFLRFDGALLVAYLPLLAFADYSLDEKFVRRAVELFLTLMSLVAVLGAAEFADAVGVPLGLSNLPDQLQLVSFAPSPPQYVFQAMFYSHNAAGAVYALAACIALSLLLHTEKVKVFSLPAFWFGATFTGLALSKSRTAYAAFLATSLFAFLYARKQTKKVLKIAVLIVLPLAAFFLTQPEVSQRVEAVTDTEDANVVGRFLYFQRALEDFSLSPVIGIGFGRYNDDSLAFSGIPGFVYIATSGEVINNGEHSHNSYLHFLAEGGVAGLLLMVGMWFSTYRWAERIQTRFPEFTFGHAFARAIQTCVILECFISFTEHSMGTAVTSLTVFTMVGLLYNLAVCEQRAPVTPIAQLQQIRGLA